MWVRVGVAVMDIGRDIIHIDNIIKDYMSEKQKITEILSHAEDVHSHNRTSCVELQNYLYYQSLKAHGQKSSSFVCGTCGISKTAVKASFKRAFKTLSNLEKANFYLQSTLNVQKALKEINKKLNEESLDNQSKVQSTTKVTAFMKDGEMYKQWTKVDLQILHKPKIIRIQQIKEEIDLHSYIMRKSMNKERSSIALQSIVSEAQPETLRLSPCSMPAYQFVSLIENLVICAQFQIIKELLKKENKFPKSKKGKLKLMKTAIELQPSPVTILLSQKKQASYDSLDLRRSIEEASKSETVSSKKTYDKIKKTLVTEEVKKSLMSFKRFKEVKKGIYHQRDGRKVRRLFQFPENQLTQEQLTTQLKNTDLFKMRRKSLEKIKLVNEIPTQNTRIIQEFHHLGEEDVEFFYFRHQFYSDNCHFFVDKSVEAEGIAKPKISTISRASIDHCIWRIRHIGNIIELLVEADIGFNKKINNEQEIVENFIGDFSILEREMEEDELDYLDDVEENEDQYTINSEDFINHSLSEIGNEEVNFYTVTGSFEDDFNFDFEKKKWEEGSAHDISVTLSKPIISQKQIENPSILLKHKFIGSPLEKVEPTYLVGEDNTNWFYQKEWRVLDSGDLLAICYDKIKVQSGALKLIIQNIGRNLFSGKSIMNTSLPIQLFSTESNLERFSKSFSFAPTFLEKAAQCKSPVQRLIDVFCFGWGTSASYIMMEKPFNPILGETYQGMIDGCPVYAEQTSHHPPIASLFMKGRGYTVYGSLESKVEFGLNYATGINAGEIHVCFDENNLKRNKVRFSCCAGTISGLIYGDRKLSIVKQTYYIDEDNRLLCIFNWGKNKKANNDYCHFNDYFEGEIVKVKEGVSLSDCEKMKMKESQIEQKYGKVYGRWTKQILFDGLELVHVEKDSPHVLSDYSPCLKSDSRFRKDIIIRKERDFVKAQDAKEELEEIQRRDRRLRKQMKK